MTEFFAYCADRVRETDRDRYLATLFAPADRRDALFALYAFDIEISRVRELARETMPGEIRLQWWREVLLGERAGEGAANPVGAAVMDILGRFAFARYPLVDLVEAHRFDVHNEPMASAEEFQVLCVADRRNDLSCGCAYSWRRCKFGGDGKIGERADDRDCAVPASSTRRTTSALCSA